MTSNNDITGDSLKSRASTQQYRDNWDLIFGSKEDNVERHSGNSDIEGQTEGPVLEQKG